MFEILILGQFHPEVLLLLLLLLVFVRLFEQAEQRSFVAPIMMIERTFTCSNKKTNMDKNSIQRNNWTFGSPACQKIWEKV